MKIKYLLLLIIMILFLSGCNKDFVGYWCKYEENSTIIVLMKHDSTDSQKEEVKKTLNTFDNIININYYSREDYAEEIGGKVEDLDIYDSYIVMFSSIDSIGTYLERIRTMDGVKEANQANARSGMVLYHFMSNGKYTFANSDEAEEKDIIKGKYKVKKGIIILKPENDKESLLYTKNGFLCEDADCSKIFSKSNKSCTAKAK